MRGELRLRSIEGGPMIDSVGDTLEMVLMSGMIIVCWRGREKESGLGLSPE